MYCSVKQRDVKGRSSRCRVSDKIHRQCSEAEIAVVEERLQLPSTTAILDLDDASCPGHDSSKIDP